jgi:homocysteine S-methyltransferase
LLGLRPIESVLNAEFLANEVPGVTVPEPVLERMRRAEGADAAAAEGIAIARDVGRELRGSVQGVHVSIGAEGVDAALQVLDGLK